MPPHHYRAGGIGRNIQQPRDAYPLKGGPHPGLRPLTEGKTGQTTGTPGEASNKGMMGVVLPMYAGGIVLYLVYTMVKVMTRRDKSERKPHGADYLSEQYSDVYRHGDGAGSRAGEDSMSLKQKVFRQQQDLEKLLLRADKDDISDGEMSELKRKLLETEAQMSRILRAMESVQEKVSTFSGAVIDQNFSEMGQFNSTSCHYEDSEYDATDDSEDYDDSEIDDNEAYIENIGTSANKISTGQTTDEIAGGEALLCTKMRNVKNFSDECGELLDNSFVLNRQEDAMEDMALRASENYDNNTGDKVEKLSDEDVIEGKTEVDYVLEDQECNQGMSERFIENDLHRRRLIRNVL